MTMDKTFDAAEGERRITQAWLDAKAFAAGAAKRRAEHFSVLIPPPNVTGSLHMGHAFNNTLQDVLVRWHRMRGFDTLWQPGTDHAGIATQMVVERELAKTNRRRTDMTREEFTALVWEQKQRSRGNIVGQLQRLGCSCDWGREAFTMGGAPGDPEGTAGGQDFHAVVIRAFVDLYERGLIYRGKRLVNWDPHFETAISDLEVENRETPGFMWHFKYPLADGATYEYVERDADGAERFRETRDYIAIATTRPETMLGDGAVAVHPSDARYTPIVGRLCEIPVGPKAHRRLIPIITDEYPDPLFGSGAVKITGAHDFNDYAVAKRAGIPLYRLMDTKARMRADGAPYAEAAALAMAAAKGERALSEAEADAVNLVPDHLRGLDRSEARAKVVEEITAEGLAVMVPATDPRLGAPSKDAKPAPGPAPGPLPAASDAASPSGASPNQTEAPAQGRGTTGAQPPLAPEEGGEPRTDPDQLVPLVEPKPIMQPHGDRSNVVIEPMLTDQWFVDTARIVGPAIEAVERGATRILPAGDEKVYFNWLRAIEPWCISRQLWWGHRIPVWYGPKFDEEGNQIDGAFARFVGSTFAEAREQALQEYQALPIGDRIEVEELPDNARQSLEDARRTTTVVNRFAERNGWQWRLPLPEESSRERAGWDVSSTGSADSLKVQIKIGRDPDVLDTWFSSGLWPLGTLGWTPGDAALPPYYPTSTLVTGFDILFFWVARMMMMQTAMTDGGRPLEDRVPFRDVYVHALVRDERGQKMSKSLGNVLDPLDLIDQFGADAVRFTLASMAAMGRDLKLSTDRIKGYRNFGTKLWNACRFAQMNGARFGAGVASGDPATAQGATGGAHGGRTGGDRGAPPPNGLRSATNRWIVGETALCRAEVDAALAAYRFDDAAAALYRFVWNVVCDWYVELAKPLLDGEHAGETRETTGWVLDRCMVMLHPFMPFVTEELWRITADRPTMLVHAPWPEDLGEDAVDADAQAQLRWLISFVESIRSARAQVGVAGGETVPVLRLDEGETGRESYRANAALIERLARIHPVEDAEVAPKGSAIVTVGTARYALPLAGVIDRAKEEARLAKSLAKLEKEVRGLAGRANNPAFAASAPAEVVEETRANLAAREAEAEAVRAALAAVRELE